MDEIALLTSLALFLLLAAACSIISNKIRLPPLIGYLITGIIIVNTMGVSESAETVVDILSNMGLILLMFGIGMEINLKKIRKQGMFAAKVAMIEIPFMILGGTIVGILLGMDTVQSITLGAVVAGSSTAVVLGVLRMQNRLSKEEIETLILVIIMEDIAQVVILSMITPLMAGSELDTGGLAAMIVSIIAFMIVSILVGLKFMPRIINWISDNVSPEILTVTTVGLAFGMALLASFVGLSVAIGAFLMGMMVASSRKSKDVLHQIEPMKNIFMAMFFISVGMEITLGTLSENIVLTLVFLVMFISLKTTAVFLGYWFGGEEPRKSISYAVSFLAMGEFAFIISKQALDYNVFSDDIYTAMVSAALLSMMCLPIISKNALPAWDKAVSVCPDPILGLLRHINDAKIAFYRNISATSKKTRKEITSVMTISYMLILTVAFLEIIFLLISPPIREWGITYFGGTDFLWSFMILLLNLFILYLPIYKLISNLRTINNISKKPHTSIIGDYNSKLIRSVEHSDKSILSLILTMSILIVVPNGLGLLEHFLVLGAGLVILLLYNSMSVRNREEEYTVDYSDESYDVTLDEFRTLIEKKIHEDKRETTVTVDTGDFNRN